MDAYLKRRVWWLGDRPVAGMSRPGVSMERRRGKLAADAVDDDVHHLWDAGFRSIVCLTDTRDQESFENAGFKFLPLPIPDGYPPSVDYVNVFLEFMEEAPEQTLVHCEGGMGRTGTMLATILILEGMSPIEAINEVRKHNPYAIETTVQEDFLVSLRAAAEENEDAS